MVRSILMCLLLAFASPAIASGEAVDTLKRVGPWRLDYDRDACHLAAEFADEKGPFLLRLTRYQLGDAVTIGLFGQRVASKSMSSRTELNFGLTSDPIETESTNGVVGGIRAAWISGVAMDAPWGKSANDYGTLGAEREAAVTGLTVIFENRKPFQLDFGSLAQPLARLRSCQADLLKSWGYDAEQQAHLSRPLEEKGSPKYWLRSEDYPEGALSRGKSGFVQFRLDIDERGKVAGCHVLDRTNPDEFAVTTCALAAKRAHYEPAIDASGKPVRSFVVHRVNWRAQN